MQKSIPKWMARLAVALLPLLAVIALMWSTLGSGFAWDDKFLMSNPAYLRSGFSWWTILTPVATNVAAFWRPVGMMFIAPQFALIPSPARAHLVSMVAYGIFCSLSALLSYALAAKSYATEDAKAIIGASIGIMLALHPGANHSAYWASNMFHLSGAILLLCASLASLRLDSLGRGKSGLAALLAGAFLAGLCSEAMMPWAFAVAGICMVFGLRRSALTWILSMGCVAAAWCWLRLAFLGNVLPSNALAGGFPACLSDLADATLAQAAPWFSGLPGAGLSVHESPALFASGLALWLGLACFGAWHARLGKAHGKLLCLWAAATLAQSFGSRLIAPENSSFVLGGEYAMGACMLLISLALAAHAWLQAKMASPSAKPLGHLAMGSIAVAMALWLGAGGLASAKLSKAWSGDLELWRASLALHPGNAVATVNEMVALSKTGQGKEALELGEAYWKSKEQAQTLTRQELSVLASYIALLDETNVEESVLEAVGMATRLVPKSGHEPMVAITAGNLFIKQGHWADAIRTANFSLSNYEKLWTGKHAAAQLHEILARAYMASGNSAEADKNYMQAVRLLGLKLKAS